MVQKKTLGFKVLPARGETGSVAGTRALFCCTGRTGRRQFLSRVNVWSLEGYQGLSWFCTWFFDAKLNGWCGDRSEIGV